MDASSITAQLMTLGDYLGSLPAIIAFTMGFVEVFKLLLIKYPVKYLSKIPTPLLAIVTAVGLTFFANYVLKSLPGDPVVLILRAIGAAAAAGGFFTWLKEPGDSPARKADSESAVKLPLANKASWVGVLTIPLALVLTSGCNGIQTLSPSQQYGLASSSVRAVADSLKFAGDSGLISDEDIVTIDPFVMQAFASLKSMREEVVKGNIVTTQWYLLQVQQFVSKLATMQQRAKELKDGSRSVGVGSNRDGVERDNGPGPGPAGSRGREEGLYAGRGCPCEQAERSERAGLGFDGGRGEGPTGQVPIPLLSLVAEVEFD